MNDYEKGQLREHWQKPGTLKALLTILPLTPEGRASASTYKRVVGMTGISFAQAEMDQVYAMLEEDGVIARDAVQSPPAVETRCTHPGPRVPCQLCDFRNHQARIKAGVRYHLTRALSEY